MKIKRFLSIMLVICIVMLAAVPFTAFAAYEDGYNCPSCGHYHWDNYTCGMCNRCSAECTNNDCYTNNHCSSCGECFDGMSELEYCVECGECRDCYDTSIHCRYCGECGSDVCDCTVCEECLTFNNAACTECGKCLKCEDLNSYSVCQSCGTGVCCAVICRFCGEACNYCEDDLQCQNCGVCGNCAVDTALCDDCGLCVKCWDTAHCRACRSCIDTIHGCGFCVDCLEFNEQICESCKSCTQCDDWKLEERCPYCEVCPAEYGELCDAGEHCDNDFVLLCDSCGACDLCVDGVMCLECMNVCGACSDFCPDCELCVNCCNERSEENGCEHNVCIKSSEWDADTHRCSQCELCFSEYWFCEDCSLCLDSCLENSESEGCTHGYCIYSSDWDAPDHLCQNCGECSDPDYFCPDCGNCFDCCIAASEAEGCAHEVCVQGSEWDEHYCSDCGNCIEDSCDSCGGCINCCTAERETHGCTHEGLCPNDPDWDEHFCSDCGDCFDDSELCPTCDMCIDCCLKATPCSCGDAICPESDEWTEHFCEVHGDCFEQCAHGTHTHTPSGVWETDDANVHYQTCTDCGNRLMTAKHAPGSWTVTQPPTESADGIREKECTTCGRVTQTESVKYASICAEGKHLVTEYRYNNKYHWGVCSLCYSFAESSLYHHKFSISNTKVCAVCDYTTVAKPLFATVGGLPLTNDGRAQTEFVAKSGQNLVIPFELAQGDNVTILLLNPATGKPINYDVVAKPPAALKKMVTYSSDAVTLNFSNQSSLNHYMLRFGTCGSTEFILCAINDLDEEYMAQARVTVTLPHETGEWQTNTNHHWKVCTKEGCKATTCEKAVHNWKSGDKCTVCGIDRPTRITVQPETVYTAYRKGGANVVTLSVTARGKNLKYAWYSEASFDKNGELITGRKPLMSKAEDSDSRYVGTDTPSLKVDILDYMCDECLDDPESYTYRCIATGDNGTAISAPIRIIVNHDTSSYRYEPLKTDVTKHSVRCPNNCTVVFSEEPHRPGFWKTTKEPTVDEEGIKTYFCRDCGLTNQTDAIPKLAAPHTHDFSEVGHDKLAHWKVCSDESCARTNGEYTFHTYGEWATVAEPTSTARGEKKRICTEVGCLQEQTAPIAKLSHICAFDDSGYAYDASNHWIECKDSDCSKTIKTAVHRFNEITITKSPTKTEAGEGTHSCTACNYKKTVALDALGEKPTLTLTEKDGSYVLHASSAGRSVLVYLASYANGRLLDVKSKDIYHTSPVIDTSAQALELNIQGADELRAMMWNFGSMTPYLPPVSLTISANGGK